MPFRRHQHHAGESSETVPDVIHSDTLDELFRGRDTDSYVQLIYEVLTVTDGSDGKVAIDD
jgi:hypothetical protein